MSRPFKHGKIKTDVLDERGFPICRAYTEVEANWIVEALNAPCPEKREEFKVITDVVVESLQEEIQKMREAISPGKVNVSCDYYCAVAKRMRHDLIEHGCVIKPKIKPEERWEP